MPKHDDPTEIEPRPQPSRPGSRPNLTHLRRDIEAGATGDKVPVLDPATSPLGTDAEAAGAPPTTPEIRKVMRTERGPRRSPLDPTDKPRGDPGAARLALGLLLLGMIGILAALVGRVG